MSRTMSSDRVEPHRGTLILVFGILALVIGGAGLILGPIAWIMGNNDLKKIRTGEMDREGEQMTSIGRILGMVATLMNAIGCVVGLGFLVVWLIIFALFASAAKEHHDDVFEELRKAQEQQRRAIDGLKDGNQDWEKALEKARRELDEFEKRNLPPSDPPPNDPNLPPGERDRGGLPPLERPDSRP